MGCTNYGMHKPTEGVLHPIFLFAKRKNGVFYYFSVFSQKKINYYPVPFIASLSL